MAIQWDIVSDSKKQLLSNLKPKKRQGFAVHPENINRKGVPKREWTWAGLMEKVADEIVKLPDGTEKTKKQLLVQRLMDDGINGVVPASKIVMDRMDGMPAQKVDLDQQGKIEVSITEDKPKEEDAG